MNEFSELKTENTFLKKSFAFAVEIVKLSKNLIEEKKDFVLSKQLMRSGTSVGALIKEAQNAESKADFIHKLSIAQKECDETIYWLDLLKETKYITLSDYNKLNSAAIELLKLLRSSILTTKQRLRNKS